MAPEAVRPGGWYVSLRWKLAAAFTLLLTAVFVVAYWTLDRSLAGSLQERLRTDLSQVAAGAAAAVDPRGLELLSDQLRAGRPLDVAVLEAQQAELEDVARVAPLERAYTYVGSPDGGLQRLAGVGTNSNGKRIADAGPVPSPSRLQLAGLVTPQLEGRGSDGDTAWGMSGYAPVLLDGRPVGAVSVDYSVAHVEQARDEQGRSLLAGFAVTYLLMLLVVLVLSRSLTERLRRVTGIADGMGAGGEGLSAAPGALVQAGRARLPDELATLAGVLADMGRRVAGRERSLVREVQLLTVQVDEARKRQAVQAITESPGFDEL
ncbi:MAG: putative sensor with domain, partial [Frankiales bacterium]|nr:putative sensor with domain [Frankiales bacterium]